jgi:hypothetical protein
MFNKEMGDDITKRTIEFPHNTYNRFKEKYNVNMTELQNILYMNS